MPSKKSKSKKARRAKRLAGWGIIFRYLSKYRKEVTLLSILGVISALANGVVPFIVGRLFDAILSPSRIFGGTMFEMPLWLSFLLAWGLVQVVANIVDWINDTKSRNVGTTIAAEYPSRAVEAMLALPVAFHKEEKTGEIWNRLMRGRMALVQIIEQVVINITPQLLSVIVGLVIAFYINPILAGIIVGGVLIYVLTLMRIVPPIVKLQKKGNRAWGKAFGLAYDAIANVQSIKQSTAESHESKRVSNKFLKVVAPIWFKVENIWSGIAFYQRIIITLTQFTVFLASVFFIRGGSLSIGGLIALNGYTGMVFGPFIRLGYNWQTIQNGIVAIERAEKILDTPPEIYEPRDSVKLKEINGGIEFKNVYFTYKKGEPGVLKGVNLKIEPGEVVALVGESGVGKSTIVDLIGGYYFADKGKVLVDGHDIRGVSLKDLRRDISIVPQEVLLFNDTVKMNIKYGSFKATDAEIKRAAEEAHADVFIDKFSKKYNQLVGERGVKLSVGQKQRIAIARAILRNPKILILDEPTSALDAQTEKYITGSLERLMVERTTIIIADRLSTVRRADRIFVFDKGKVVEEGKHEDLIKIKGGAYQKLYRLHVGLA